MVNCNHRRGTNLKAEIYESRKWNFSSWGKTES